MQTLFSIIFWLAPIAYGVSFALFATAIVFKKSVHMDRALVAAWVGLMFHTAAISIRWFETGYPPFVSYHESMSASAWFGVLAFLLMQQKFTFLRAAGIGAMPLVTLLMGWSGTQPVGFETLPVGLQSFWLFIHASFATAAAGCFLFAAGIGVVRLYKTRMNGRLDPVIEATAVERYDEFNFRLCLLGFLFWGMMITSGAIWADLAWGRYWGWDPIELWSLITWLVYALYLHIYVTWRKLRGRFLAWYSAAAVFFAAFSLWGVRFFYETIHTYGS
jgi:cytochrome c-type biogenesis protein CcsB